MPLNKLKSKGKHISPSIIPSAKSHSEALEKTLLYAKLFDSGIREDMLHQQIFDLKLSNSELNSAVSESISKGIIIRKDNYLFVNYTGNNFYSKKKSKLNKAKVEKLLLFLKKLPFVSMIAFSGGTSHYGILDHDDIDLFIITKPDSVYIVYLIIHIFAYITHTRKELCANYLIDETNLEINHSYDFYTAHQIISLIPFKNPEVLRKFWQENKWVNKFFPNFYSGNSIASISRSKHFMLNSLNRVLMLLYKRYFRKKILLSTNSSSIILTENCLKLHTNDNSTKIIFEFENLIHEYYRSKRFSEYSQPEKQLTETVL
jgi:hypothetical protein